jgi:hypothetical protein
MDQLKGEIKLRKRKWEHDIKEQQTCNKTIHTHIPWNQEFGKTQAV